MSKQLQIRNSTAEFLIFQAEDKAQGVQVGELQQDSVCAKFAHTAEDGKTYSTLFYKLDAIISEDMPCPHNHID